MGGGSVQAAPLMKAAGLPLLLLAAAGSITAEDTPPAPTGKISPRLGHEIRATLPTYTPPAPRVLDRPNTSADESDAELLALPKVTVREKRPPRIDPDELLTEGELNKKMARTYRESLVNGLDRFLNSFTIPIFSASPAERGRDLVVQRKFEDIGRIAILHRTVDAENSAGLKADLAKSERAMDWQDRPAGDGLKK
jgi:hypothetical protein